MNEALQERLTRFGFGLSALGALCWFLWPTNEWRPEPESGLAFASTLTIWIFLEAKGFLTKPTHPHDIEFFRAIRNQISLDTIRFLESHDFGAAFTQKNMEPLWKLHHEAQTKAFRPHDQKLASAFDLFRDAMNIFVMFLASTSGTVGTRMNLFAIPSDKERARDDFSDETVREIQKANELSDEVVRTFNAMMHEARVRAPEAFNA